METNEENFPVSLVRLKYDHKFSSDIQLNNLPRWFPLEARYLIKLKCFEQNQIWRQRGCQGLEIREFHNDTNAYSSNDSTKAKAEKHFK